MGFIPEEVEALCREWGMDYAECRRWYDGYYQNGYEIYTSNEGIVKVWRLLLEKGKDI